MQHRIYATVMYFATGGCKSKTKYCFNKSIDVYTSLYTSPSWFFAAVVHVVYCMRHFAVNTYQFFCQILVFLTYSLDFFDSIFGYYYQVSHYKIALVGLVGIRVVLGGFIKHKLPFSFVLNLRGDKINFIYLIRVRRGIKNNIKYFCGRIIRAVLHFTLFEQELFGLIFRLIFGLVFVILVILITLCISLGCFTGVYDHFAYSVRDISETRPIAEGKSGYQQAGEGNLVEHNCACNTL